MPEETTKIPSRLVDIQRQEPWWHDQESYFVRPKATPAVSGSRIGIILGPLVYCLDADYDYANLWEVQVEPQIAESSPPTWWGKDKLVFAALLRDGRYQSISVDHTSASVGRRTLMKGEPYKDLYIFEDRSPIQPLITKGDCKVITPYGHVYSHTAKKRSTLGGNLRVRYAPCVTEEHIVLHLARKEQTWLEWRNPDTLQKHRMSRRVPERYGITTGHVGTAPVPASGSIICGFGDRLICFDAKGKESWQFTYPRIRNRGGEPPLRVATPDGETLYHLNYAQIRRSHRRWSCGDSGTRVNSVISQVVFSAVSLPV